MFNHDFYSTASIAWLIFIVRDHLSRNLISPSHVMQVLSPLLLYKLESEPWGLSPARGPRSRGLLKCKRNFNSLEYKLQLIRIISNRSASKSGVSLSKKSPNYNVSVQAFLRKVFTGIACSEIVRWIKSDTSLDRRSSKNKCTPEVNGVLELSKSTYNDLVIYFVR